MHLPFSGLDGGQRDRFRHHLRCRALCRSARYSDRAFALVRDREPAMIPDDDDFNNLRVDAMAAKMIAYGLVALGISALVLAAWGLA